jgi:WD40 repeat protein/energy-coupling factor transporter ATP-binding protein EcfA2
MTSDAADKNTQIAVKDVNVGRDLTIEKIDQRIINISYGEDPDEEKVAATIDANSPYLGLASFTAETSKNFYGRKKLVESLLQELEKDNLIFLLGASGSGKSSLVKAGMIPKLIQSNINKKPFIELSFVPSDDPFGYFFEKLPLPPREKINLYIESEIYNNKVNLHSIIERARQGKNDSWLIFIDQFEEILTTTSKDEGLLFVQFLDNLISSLRKSQDNSIKLILAMRTDFLDQFMNAFPDFVVTIQSDGRKPFSYITPMTDRELKLVIKNPAATHGVNVEQDLIEEMIDDFRGESRSLPLLQYTLDLLWQKDDLSDRLLNQEPYEDIGKVGGALQQQAEKIYQHFESKGLEKSVEYIFVRLITITADGKRVSKRENKSRFSGELEKIVDELVKEHRLLISGRQLDTVEIAHEALISSWKRLRGWIAKHDKEIILERQLVESAQTWWEIKTDEKRAISELWTGAKLGRILKLIKEQSLSNLGDVVNRFIQASVDHYQQLQKAEAETRQREVDSDLSLANSLGRYSSVLFDTHKELEAFIEAIKAGRILRKHKAIDGKVLNALDKVLLKGSEYNRLEGHTHTVYSVSFSADGKTLASGSEDKTIKLWDVETGAEIRTLSGHTHTVYRVSFSADGKTLASGSRDDGKIKLWNVETGDEIRILSGHTNIVGSFSFSADGKTLASGSWDKTIKFWNVETGAEICTLSGHTNEVTSVSFSGDGKTLVSSSWDKTIKFWNVETGREIHTLTGYTNDVNSYNGISFSADGKTLASGGGDKIIKLWNVETGAEICTLSGHTNEVTSVSFSGDGKTLASGSWDKTIKLWNVETGAEIRTLSGHTHTVTSVSFSADGKTLASGSLDKTIKLWNVETGAEIRTLSRHIYSSGYRVNLSADGKTLASCNHDDEKIKLWNVETGAEIRTLSEHTSGVMSVSFSADGKTLASGSLDETIKLWNVETGAEIRTLSGHTSGVMSVSFSADGKTLASGSTDKTIKLWNVETGAEIRVLSGHRRIRVLSGHISSVTSVSFSADGKTLASGSLDKTIKLWNIETGAEIRTLFGHRSHVYSVSFSADGKTLASGSLDETIKLWNVETRAEIRTLSGHTSSVYSVSFSADGKTLASGSHDNTIKLWNVETGAEIRTISGHTSGVFSVSFSGDGKTLASGSTDNTIKLWDVDLDSLMARSCDWVRNYLTHNPNVSESDRHLCDGIGTKKQNLVTCDL